MSDEPESYGDFKENLFLGTAAYRWWLSVKEGTNRDSGWVLRQGNHRGTQYNCGATEVEMYESCNVLAANLLRAACGGFSLVIGTVTKEQWKYSGEMYRKLGFTTPRGWTENTNSGNMIGITYRRIPKSWKEVKADDWSF